MDLTLVPSALEANIIGNLNEAKKKNELLVVLVDPNTLEIEQFRDFLHPLDTWFSVNTIVFLLWDKDGRHIADKREKLRQLVEGEVLPYGLSSPSYVGNIEDCVTFESELAERLVKAQLLTAQTAERIAVTKRKLPLATLGTRIRGTTRGLR